MPTFPGTAAIPDPRLGEARAWCPHMAPTARPDGKLKRPGTNLSGPLPRGSSCPQTASGPRTADTAPAYGALARQAPQGTELPRCPAS